MARPVHTPTLLQMEAVECGAASLGIVLAHHGKIVPLAQLRQECGISRDGSNALNLVRAARRHGLEAKGYSTTSAELSDVKAPAILFWGFNHFLVLEGIRGNTVYLNDPAVGHRQVELAELEECFTGVVLTMQPGDDFERGGRRPRLATALSSRLGGFRRPLAFAVLVGVLLVVPGLVIPALTQVFVDDVLIADRTDWLWPLVATLLLATGAVAALEWLQLSCLRRLRLGLAAKLSAQYFQHLLRLPVSFYEQRYAGDIANRSRLNDKVANVLSGQLARTLIDVLMMVFYASLMFFYDVSLTLIGVGSAALNFAILSSLARRRVVANMRLLQEYGKVEGASIAGIQSMETIKASGMESGFFERWAGLFANASNARRELSLANALLGVVPGLLSWITALLVLVVGGGYVIEGRLTVGMLVAFQILMWSFLRPVGTLVGLGRTAQELQGDLARLDDVLANPTDADSGAAGYLAPETWSDLRNKKLRLDGRLDLRDVTFGYNPSAPPLLENFNLTLEPGKRVALVGGSGSGKTTVAKLVCGLYEPWSGGIYFDGVERRQVPSWLMGNSLSLVDQDILMFSGSVRQNLSLWDETLPERSLIQGCVDAEIHDVVRSLPGGLDGELCEGGANLSGGERQRLEIARALANNPSILVLDEATSALDAESERLIVERIGLRGCSCLCVAHRLSTIRDCDEIIVLDRGRVVERGTHEELWERGGTYSELLRTADGTERRAS